MSAFFNPPRILEPDEPKKLYHTSFVPATRIIRGSIHFMKHLSVKLDES